MATASKLLLPAQRKGPEPTRIVRMEDAARSSASQAGKLSVRPPIDFLGSQAKVSTVASSLQAADKHASSAIDRRDASDKRAPAIHVYGLSRDEGSARAQKQKRSADDVLRFPQPSHWNVVDGTRTKSRISQVVLR